jgi:transcription antitermination factor NusG
MERNWYVICTKQQQEKKVAALLTKKGIENYCPYNTVEKKMGANKITITEPLFKSYVFALLAESEILTVKSLPFIINTVYWKSKPVIVRKEEMNALKIIADSFKSIRLERVAVCINDKIENFKDNISELGNNLFGNNQQRIAVTISSLGYTIIATKENFRYSPLEKPFSAGEFFKKLNLFSFFHF